MFFSRPAGHKFVHRGNPDGYDWTAGDFTVDSGFHDLDLSGIIPVNTKLVLLRAKFKSAEIGKFFELQRKGDYYHVNMFSLFSIVSNQWSCGDCLIQSDADRLIEYAITTGSSPTINLMVGGWWVL